MNTVCDFFRSRTVQVFAELGVADDIAAGRAPRVNTRFLRACAAAGLIREAGGSFALTAEGEALRSDVPGSMRAFAAAVMGGGHYRAWGNLAYSAQTEACAFEETFGEGVWTYFTKTNQTEGRLFNQAMANSNSVVVPAVLRHYDFPQAGTFVDVAGGNGSLLAAILSARPQARGIVMDLAFARLDAERNLAAAGVADRCRFEAGDFFEAVPAGGDLYTMKWILHDFDDDKAGAILRNVRAAMPATAKLLLIEAIVPEEGDALLGHMMDMNMLVMCGGRERTASHWRELLAANGFRIDRIIPLPGPVSILETVPDTAVQTR